jgi:hypothetical protein
LLVSKIKLLLLFLPLFTFAQSISVTHPNGKYGNFSTYELHVQALNDGTHRVKLLEDLIFIDSKFKRWTAPKGSIVDGATIPAEFQSIIGTPYGGAYTLASVIHDVACEEQSESWQEVHRAFYDGMLASGVDKDKASLMYLAVYEGGPRWGNNTHEHLSANALLQLVGGDDFTKLLNDLQPFVNDLVTVDLSTNKLDLNAILNAFSIEDTSSKPRQFIDLGTLIH